METQSGVKLLAAFVWTHDQVARQREGLGMFGSTEKHEVYGLQWRQKVALEWELGTKCEMQIDLLWVWYCCTNNFNSILRMLYALSNVLLCPGIWPDKFICCKSAIKEEHTPNMYLIITYKLKSVLLCSLKLVYLMHVWVDMACSHLLLPVHHEVWRKACGLVRGCSIRHCYKR